MDDHIDEIISNNSTCYFVSPHLDDAAYSAGALINELSKTNKVIVINIFTTCGDSDNSRWGNNCLKECGYSNAAELYRDRESEDFRALSGIADIINLGFIDAPWRQKSTKFYNKLSKISPDMSAVYSILRRRIRPGIISLADNNIINSIKTRLLDIVNTDNSVIFCPLAQGRHVDHLIARKVCDELFTNLIYWSDYPYNLEHSIEKADESLNEYKFEKNLKFKEELVKKYKTQYEFVIKDNPVDQLVEYFYTSTKSLDELSNNRVCSSKLNKLQKV